MSFYLENSPLLNKQNIALFVNLQDLKGNEYLLVNTHLIFNKNRGDIKTCQISLIRRAIKKIITSKDWNKKPFIILGGDFNLTPSSLLYKFITENDFEILKKFRKFEWSGQSRTEKYFKYSRSSFREKLLLSNQKFDMNIQGRFMKSGPKSYEEYDMMVQTLDSIEIYIENSQIKIKMRDKSKCENSGLFGEKFDPGYIFGIDVNFKSSYAQINTLNNNSRYYKSSNEPLFTTQPEEVPTTVDYLFYNGDIHPKAVLDVPDISQILGLSILYQPSKINPSDHFCIYAEFVEV